VKAAMQEELGACLKQWRTGKGLTLDQAAARAGVSKRTLLRWEAGKTLPRLPELEAVLAALGVAGARRRHALSRIEAPRAARLLRRESELDARGQELGTLPMGGDLLRAMRLRRGRTLEEVAQSIGVRASVISRWERSEMWPETAHLHAFCYTLGAREEELMALLQGRFLLSEGRRHTVEEIEQRFERFRRAPFTVQRLALMDLEFFALAAAIWPLAERQEAFRALLGRVHVRYADFLFGQNRFSECDSIATRAQDLLAPCSGGGSMIAYAAIRGAAVKGSGRQGARRAADTLQWALSFPVEPTPRIWLLCELGHAYQRLGRKEETAQLGRAAWQTVEQVENSDFRQVSLHRVLGLFVDAGCYREAIDTVSHIDRSLETYPFNAIRMAQLNLGLGDRAEAHAWIERAYAMLDNSQALYPNEGPYLPYFRLQVDRVAAEL
jgi:transcriptional regulator with XRE-family HTH domain